MATPYIDNTNSSLGAEDLFKRLIVVDESGEPILYTMLGEGSSVTAGGRTKLVSGAVTRPNDTTAYASGDVVGGAITFSSAARTASGSGKITGIRMIDSANQSTKLDCDLFLFTSNPAAILDNAAFAPTDAEMLTCVGVATFTGTASKVANAGSGAAGSVFYPSSITNAIGFVAGAGAALYGYAVARNTYTPVAQEIFTFILDIEQN